MGWDGYLDEEAYYGCINCEHYKKVEYMKKFEGYGCFLNYKERLQCPKYKDKWFRDTMGDAEAIGCLIYEFVELLSRKYYDTNNIKMKSHIVFGLYTLMDLVTLVERENLQLDIRDTLLELNFFEDDNAVKLIKKELDLSDF